MKERYKAFTLEQWEEYERYWRDREAKASQIQPTTTEILDQIKKPAKKKKEQPKQVFEQLELFPLPE